MIEGCAGSYKRVAREHLTRTQRRHEHVSRTAGNTRMIINEIMLSELSRRYFGQRLCPCLEGEARLGLISRRSPRPQFHGCAAAPLMGYRTDFIGVSAPSVEGG